jgi:hypothetical protein
LFRKLVVILILSVIPFSIADDFVPEKYQDNFVYSVSVESEETPPLASLIEDGYIVASPLESASEASLMALGSNICPLSAQCVAYLKENGFNIKGNAKDIPINTDEPCRGCGIIFLGGKFGHAGIVYDYDKDMVCFSERNYLSCGAFSKRCVMRSNPKIKGYLIK